MIGSIDVHYEENNAFVGLVLFEHWSSERALSMHRTVWDSPSTPYVPGEFYKRELPCIKSSLNKLTQLPDLLIIDGYVWLGDSEGVQKKPGLGEHLFQALGKRIPIIGVAKSKYSSNCGAICVIRGISKNPLYVSASGIDTKSAAENVKNMHGSYRLPTMLKLADQLARQEISD